MYKIYLKQAWALIRQEKLFSGVYIVGTGLAISMVMVLSIVFYLKIANIYPETNRDRMLIAQSGALIYKQGGMGSSSLSKRTILACFENLKGLEAMTLFYQEWGMEFFIQPEKGREPFEVIAKFTDTGFWSVFPYRFLAGKPFTEADVSSGIPVAVVSSSLARRVFGEEEAVGRQVSLNFKQYKVVGVVADGSLAMERSYAQIWIPYLALPNYTEDSWDKTGTLGRFQAVLLAAPGTNLDVLKAEAEANVRRLSQTKAPDTFMMGGQPDKQWQSLFRRMPNTVPDYPKKLALYGGIFLVFLLVPAVSLSGMADSRMERRLDEMGVRRAFGASAKTLIGQVITENLLFTLLGGVFGLVLSYLLIYTSRGWIMDVTLGNGFSSVTPEGVDMTFSPAMLMNFSIFSIALGVCLALNLLTSLIPAWRSSRRPIIESLNGM